MNKITNPMVDAYLAELEQELQGLPDAVARDILDGVREELAGLDPQQAAAMIEQLGDPAFIAAEARAADGLPTVQQREPRGYVFLTAMIVALGGVIVPLIGWVVGIVMMWLSTSWRRWEKWVATLSPFLVLIAGYAVTLISRLAPQPPKGDSDFHGPSFEDFFPVSDNPFAAAYFEYRIDGIFLFFACCFIVGMWLLWRGLRKPDASPAAARPTELQGELPHARPVSQGYVVTAALLVALGGAVVPVLGWVAGVVMVWASDAWRTWEKWVATLAPLAVAAVTVIALLEIRAWGVPRRYATYQPEPTPMMPFPSDVLWAAILAVVAANCIAGVWLLWRAVAAADTGTPRQFVDRAPL